MPWDSRVARQQLICDIDKTYLETEFDSLARMVRIVFEAAAAKVTVSGASEVLRAARWGHVREQLPAKPQKLFRPRPLHFVSSSPPQLRPVLEEKLLLDGLDWSSDTFKNQAYNLRMGRMDLLRQHVAYKSFAILSVLEKAGEGTKFYMIGDNAESDAYIYVGLKLRMARRLSLSAYEQYLMHAGVEPAVAEVVAQKSERVAKVQIAEILIRNVPGYHFIAEPPLTDGVRVFDNFFQVSLVLMMHGVIGSGSLWELARNFHNQHGMTQEQLRAELMHAAIAVKGLEYPQQQADMEISKILDQKAGHGSLAALAADIAAAQVRLGHKVQEQEMQQAGPLLPLAPGAAFEAMSESEILSLAAVWSEKIHKQKA
jgi:hypothetical protein